MRIDKWLWAARFYKTRSLASDELQKGRVQVNDQEAKPAREIKVGDTVSLRQAAGVRTVVVQILSQQRGPAPVAQQLYAETPESVLRRETAQAQGKLAREPALSIEQGRPTKRQRRDLDQARHGWDDRWSASIDNP